MTVDFFLVLWYLYVVCMECSRQLSLYLLREIESSVQVGTKLDSALHLTNSKILYRPLQSPPLKCMIPSTIHPTIHPFSIQAIQTISEYTIQVTSDLRLPRWRVLTSKLIAWRKSTHRQDQESTSHVGACGRSSNT